MDALLFLQDSSPVPQKENPKSNEPMPSQSLCILNGRSSFYWTARALAESRLLQTIYVVAENDELAKIRADWPNDARFVEHILPTEPRAPNSDSDKDIAEVLATFRRESSRLIRKPTLVLNCNSAHLRGTDFDAAIRLFNAQNDNEDSAAFMVAVDLARKTLDSDTPTSLVKGELLASFGVIGPRAIEGALEVAERFAPAISVLGGKEDKVPTSQMLSLGWKIGHLLGFGFAWRLLRRNATASEIERVATRVLKAPIRFLRGENPHWVLTPSSPARQARIEKLLRGG